MSDTTPNTKQELRAVASRQIRRFEGIETGSEIERIAHIMDGVDSYMNKVLDEAQRKILVETAIMSETLVVGVGDIKSAIEQIRKEWSDE